MGEVLGMATMLFADEVLAPERLDEVAEAAEVKVTQRELDVAKQLVQSLAGDFEADRFHDTYRQQVLALIERKAQGKAIAVPPPPEAAPTPAPDLMSALKASLEAVRAREGDGAGQSKPRKASSAKAAGKPAAGKPAATKSAGKKPAGKKPAASRAAAKR